MKKLVLSILLLSAFFTSSAQEQTADDISFVKQNELKINGLFLVVGAFDVTYERLLNEESGLGINVFVPYDSEIKEDINYYISPYYRFYFGKKYAAGFFLEGFGMLNSVKTDEFFFGDDVFVEEVNSTDFALGIGLGGKWVTKGGFVGEINFGIGRNLFNSDEFGDEFVAKLGINLGYRF